MDTLGQPTEESPPKGVCPPVAPKVDETNGKAADGAVVSSLNVTGGGEKPMRTEEASKTQPKQAATSSRGTGTVCGPNGSITKPDTSSPVPCSWAQRAKGAVAAEAVKTQKREGIAGRAVHTNGCSSRKSQRADEGRKVVCEKAKAEEFGVFARLFTSNDMPKRTVPTMWEVKVSCAIRSERHEVERWRNLA